MHDGHEHGHHHPGASVVSDDIHFLTVNLPVFPFAKPDNYLKFFLYSRDVVGG
jgi:hypothetical protein